MKHSLVNWCFDAGREGSSWGKGGNGIGRVVGELWLTIPKASIDYFDKHHTACTGEIEDFSYFSRTK
jgi:hypothetical protein